DRQIPVPAALSVVGFDDITFAQFTQPALTTVAVPRAEIGRVAFQSLWTLIHDSSAGSNYEVKTTLVVRQTTAAPPQVSWGEASSGQNEPDRRIPVRTVPIVVLLMEILSAGKGGVM